MSRTKKLSFEKINYTSRPRKQIERKILIETLQKMRPIINIEKYKYIGMGSIYYYDFIMFHKFLNINRFISIDDKETKKRFEFNRPYQFIKFINNKSTEFLESYKWEKNEKIFMWLDYDKGLFAENEIKEDLLNDLTIVSKKCNPGDILIFTINAICPKKPNEKKHFFDRFKNYFSQDLRDIRKVIPKYYVQLLHDLAINYVNEKSEHTNLKFYQLFCFEYRDGAPMFTLGGFFDKDNSKIEKIKDLKFISTGKEIIKIDVPLLTYYEKIYLDTHIDKVKKSIDICEKQIPVDTNNREDKIEKKLNKKIPFEISYRELKSYVEIYYRYFPQYYEGLV